MGTTYTTIINGVPYTADSKEKLSAMVGGPGGPASSPEYNPWGTTAAANYAQVTRQQWEEYKNFGVPVENQLINMIGNTENVNRDVTAATQYGLARESINKHESARKLGGYGLSQTADEAKVNDRLSQMNTAASMSDAVNAVRRNAKDMDRQILIGGVPNDGLDSV